MMIRILIYGVCVCVCVRSKSLMQQAVRLRRSFSAALHCHALVCQSYGLRVMETYCTWLKLGVLNAYKLRMWQVGLIVHPEPEKHAMPGN